MKLQVTLLCAALAFQSSLQAQKAFSVNSPDGQLRIGIKVSPRDVSYCVTHGTDTMIAPSVISMKLLNGTHMGVNPRLAGKALKTIDQTIESPIYKRAKVEDKCNELTLRFKGDYQIVFRAYDEGAAYRFVSTAQDSVKVENEQAEFCFPADDSVYLSYVRHQAGENTFEQQLNNSFENTYDHVTLSNLDKRRLAFLPIVVANQNGKKVLITESDLLDYPGMYLYNPDGKNRLTSYFAHHPAEVTSVGATAHTEGHAQASEPYIARYKSGTAMPWRIMAISTNDAQLSDCDMVYKLASPSAIGDPSWIKPGMVLWDWWSNWNLYGVDFRAGVNNETYKYQIDYASKQGIPYILLDEGWTVRGQSDLTRTVPSIDLPELVRYGQSKNVGLILWSSCAMYSPDMEHYCQYFSEMGIKGFKIDFLNRDDQQMVDFERRAAETTARHKLLLDFHGTYKPGGLNRTYPNVVNFEGVNGLETVKWTQDYDEVTYDVTIPFIRMAAGPMDYTQGAMRNATRECYRSVNSEPMSQGTRCRQLAEYVVFDSPLCMMCDNASNYLREPECATFIAGIPTVWDDTQALDGAIGQYISMARRKGDTWYVGGMTNWQPRTLTLDLSMLGEGEFTAEIFRDGINADRAACDFKQEKVSVPTDRKMQIHMAPGGGFAMKIQKK